jgi:hypothetical protein
MSSNCIVPALKRAQATENGKDVVTFDMAWLLKQIFFDFFPGVAASEAFAEIRFSLGVCSQRRKSFQLHERVKKIVISLLAFDWTLPLAKERGPEIQICEPDEEA